MQTNAGSGSLKVPGFGVVTLVNTSVMTGVEEQIHSNNLSIVPNPAGDRVQVTWTTREYTPDRLTVVNSLGIAVMEMGLQTARANGIPQITLDVSGLPREIYFVNLMSNDKRESKMLVLSK